MKALSVIDLAKLYGFNRQTIYKRINKGDLSKNSDGKIDLSEAIRVFGEPSSRSNSHVTKVQPTEVQKSAEVDILKQQVDMLQKQLDLAQEREQFQREQLQAKDEQIQAIQLLLNVPKAQVVQEAVLPVKPLEQEESLSPLDVNHVTQEVQQSSQEPKKRRGLFGRVIRAVLE